MLQRRRFLQLSTGVTLASAAGPVWSRRAAAENSLVERALAEGQDRVVIATAAGTYMDRLFEHFFNPFTDATGITVTNVGGSYGERRAQLVAMHEVGNVEWDIMVLDGNDAQNPEVSQYLTDLGDCAALPNLAANSVDGACTRYGVLFDVGGLVLTYDERAFPDGGPQNWAEFWDVERFPGPRAFPDYGWPWVVLIPALLADGVAPDALFPLDLDRAFGKLDELRPDITVWWTSGDNSQQLFRNQEVAMALMWSGRVGALRDEGLPLRSTWNGAFLADYPFCVLREAPRPLAAMALIDFLFTRPEAHVAFTTEMHYATTLQGVGNLVDPDLWETMPTHPDNWSRVIRMDPTWLAENRDAVVGRWTAWISG